MDTNTQKNEYKTLPWQSLAMLIVAGLGFLDTIYLTITHYNVAPTICAEGFQCELVTGSSYASVFGVPLAVLGLVYYVFHLVILLYFRHKKDLKMLALSAWLSVAGVIFSAYLVYVQLGVLHAICQYCMISAATSTLLFILSIWWWIGKK